MAGPERKITKVTARLARKRNGTCHVGVRIDNEDGQSTIMNGKPYVKTLCCSGPKGTPSPHLTQAHCPNVTATAKEAASKMIVRVFIRSMLLANSVNEFPFLPFIKPQFLVRFPCQLFPNLWPTREHCKGSWGGGQQAFLAWFSRFCATHAVPIIQIGS